MSLGRGLAVYIHWPFCLSKCPYCDFNSHVGDSIDQAVWRRAYRRELEHYAALLPGRRVTSIFLGGGTPSLMDRQTVETLIMDVGRLWPLDDAVEITMEANPSSVEVNKFAAFRAAGVNRLSLGVQSLNDEALRFLERAHDVADARRAIELAARFFPRFSFDLIYARQGQTPAQWREELREALTLAGGHLSLYQLTIEPHTRFHTRMRRGEVLTAADDYAATMYETTQEIMDTAGLPAYEISNHARTGQASRHNLTYWHYEDYIGIGPGAHGRIRTEEARLAIENYRAPDAWLRQIETHHEGSAARETLPEETAMREAVMMGLRLREGMDLAEWSEKFSLPLPALFPDERLTRLQNEGLIELTAETLRATAAGLQRLNAVLAYALG